MTDGLVERMESELGRPCTAVVTGGLGRFVVQHCRRRLVYDEYLLLRGLGMIWRRAQGEFTLAVRWEMPYNSRKRLFSD